MYKDLTSHCQLKINGQPVAEADLVRWELERGRVALTLLKKNLGIKGLRELLRDEIAQSERRHREWSDRSHGKWVASASELEVRGITTEEFLGWLQGVIASNDWETLDAACPEHYVVAPSADGRLDVIETIGGFGLPVRFVVQTSADPGNVPDPNAVDPNYPIRMCGSGFGLDGTETGRILHQFANTADGFKAKLAIYFSAAADPELVEGHKWHLVCEFTNMVNMCLESKGLR